MANRMIVEFDMHADRGWRDRIRNAIAGMNGVALATLEDEPKPEPTTGSREHDTVAVKFSVYLKSGAGEATENRIRNILLQEDGVDEIITKFVAKDSDPDYANFRERAPEETGGDVVIHDHSSERLRCWLHKTGGLSDPRYNTPHWFPESVRPEGNHWCRAPWLDEPERDT